MRAARDAVHFSLHKAVPPGQVLSCHFSLTSLTGTEPKHTPANSKPTLTVNKHGLLLLTLTNRLDLPEYDAKPTL